MPILDKPLTKKQLLENFCHIYQSMTKGVVDLESGLIALEADMHADLEGKFLNQGSRQRDLWGFNLYPEKNGTEFVEYTSLINIRPAHGNASIEVRDPVLREQILSVIGKWIIDA